MRRPGIPSKRVLDNKTLRDGSADLRVPVQVPIIGVSANEIMLNAVTIRKVTNGFIVQGEGIWKEGTFRGQQKVEINVFENHESMVKYLEDLVALFKEEG